MARLLAFNKPYGVLSQFRASEHGSTLAEYIPVAGVYPAGRLDKDSEGLLLLTDDGALQHAISHPRHKLAKTYWVQVEGVPDANALKQLASGTRLKDGITAPAQVKLMEEPELWPRTPAVRFRANIPTSWLELTIKEGRNRQVRRMTAAVGYPTLRLIRYAIGPWTLDKLAPRQWCEVVIPETFTQNDTGTTDTQRPRHRRRHRRTRRKVSHGRRDQ